MKFKTKRVSFLLVVMLLLSSVNSLAFMQPQTASAATDGPKIINVAPANNMTGLNPESLRTFTVWFDEAVVKNNAQTNYVTLYKATNNSVVGAVPISQTNISNNGTEVTFSFGGSNLFELNTAYYIRIDGGSFLNKSNSAAFVGINDAVTWSFTTAATIDQQKPNVQTYAPTNQQASTDTSLTMTFDKPVRAASGSITLQSAVDNRTISVTSTEVSGSGTSTIRIKPSQLLIANTDYTVTVPAGSFQDLQGNAASEVKWSFATGKAPVTLVGKSPRHHERDVAVRPALVLTFDQPIQKFTDNNTSKMIEIRRVSDNGAVFRESTRSSNIVVHQQTATITLPSDLQPNTAYYVWIESGAFYTAAGDFPGITSASEWTFTTGYGNDSIAPTIDWNKTTPVRNGRIAGSSVPLKITFSEPVYLGTGDITIRQSVGGAVFRSIPLHSSRITGAGTNELTIDANKAIGGESAKYFVTNTKYYVEIGRHAVQDAAGNKFVGLAGGNDWSFTISSDANAPQLESSTPASGYQPAALRQQFTATFNKPVKVANSGEIQLRPVQSSNGARNVTVHAWVDETNKRMIRFSPSTDLERNTEYYVYIGETAIEDMVGNSFVGVLNEYRWRVTTIGGDSTAPSLSTAEASGTTVRLLYNEALDPDHKPSAGYYYVSVGGVARNVTKVDVAGTIVTLTVSGSSISNSQQVKISYTKPSQNKGSVRDLSGNEAASFSNYEVKNGFTNKAPTLKSGSASGSTVILNFDQTITDPGAYAYAQFTVYVNGVFFTPTSLSVSGSSVVLNINGTVYSSDTVRVSYHPGTAPLAGQSGLSVAAISNYTVSQPGSGGSGGNNGGGGNQAQVPPILQYVTATGTTVQLKYTKVLNPYTTPPASLYRVTVDGVARTIQSVLISGDTITLTLPSPVTANQVVKVTYSGSPSYANDYYGYYAFSITDITAIGAGSGWQPGLPATMRSAIIKGAALTLSFTETLQQYPIPSSSLFVVRVNDQIRMVSYVAISANNVSLTLPMPVAVGDRVTVTYTSTDSGLKTLSGSQIASFSNTNVANQTTLIDTLTGDYEVIDTNAVGLKSSAATKQLTTSPSGISVNKYTIMNEKFITAVTTAHKAGISNPRVVFQVPGTEGAAVVALSVAALEMAYKQNGNANFAVAYGDTIFEVPLQQLKFAELARFGNGSSVGNEVIIMIEQGSSDKTATLDRQMKQAKTSLLGGPIYVQVDIKGYNEQKPITDFTSYLTGKITTSATINPAQAAIVTVDPATGLLSYAPTTLGRDGFKTIATFKKPGTGAFALVQNTKTLSDLNNHWAASEVQMMLRKSIVDGHSNSKFEPNKSITRGEFATYIARGLGLAGNRSAAAAFKDVNTNTDMGAYIGAAAKAGIIKGVTKTSFKPNDKVKREDMAIMMLRAAQFTGINTKLPEPVNVYLQPFKDANKISSYAKSAMAQAIHLGVIKGMNTTILSPKSNATRAEGTVMIRRLLEKVEFLTIKY
ncbi:Ig-like domain-containing protein [Paenibacillus yanchengensis]|uniref:Ig-like domain-containing protein n=1 Tax=Paenibacillus yanchengensis TaxID=2035833 RepID=A0ABW4YMW1_9BACL